MRVDFNNVIGKIKPFHAMNGLPLVGCKTDLLCHFKRAGIPYARLHDMGTDAMRPMVDIHHIFPDFNADADDPASYSFTYTDHIIKSLADNGVCPYFRLGETFENDVRRGFPARNINPPRDFDKWARICEHIVRHYNEGWADGYRLGIKYWEIWNEPENGVPGAPVEKTNQGWTGTKEQYYELYSVTAKHLKACFGDSIKIGGYGCCTMYGFFDKNEVPERAAGASEYRLEFFRGFMEHISKNKVPFDFFTFHSYWDIAHNLQMPYLFRRELEKYGYGDIEMHLNEWNNVHTYDKFDTDEMAAQYCAMMIAMHGTPLDMMFFYRGERKMSEYAPLFDRRGGDPTAVFNLFIAYNELYKLEGQLACDTGCDDLYALCATDGSSYAVLISNLGEDAPLDFDLSGYKASDVMSGDALTDLRTIKRNQVVLLLK